MNSCTSISDKTEYFGTVFGIFQVSLMLLWCYALLRLAAYIRATEAEQQERISTSIIGKTLMIRQLPTDVLELDELRGYFGQWGEVTWIGILLSSDSKLITSDAGLRKRLRRLYLLRSRTRKRMNWLKRRLVTTSASRAELFANPGPDSSQDSKSPRGGTPLPGQSHQQDWRNHDFFLSSSDSFSYDGHSEIMSSVEFNNAQAALPFSLSTLESISDSLSPTDSRDLWSA